MKIAIGTDHGGYKHKSIIIDALEKEGHIVVDCGCFSEESCDYPDYAGEVAELVSTGKCDKGVLICRTGVGMSIVANKFRNVRASVCFNDQTAKFAGAHLDANILCLSGDFFSTETMVNWLKEWLNTKFEGGRHLRRIEKIKKLEKKILK